MPELRFAWDEAKNRENQRRHGVSFEEAETVFLMPHEAYSYISSRLIKEVAGHGGSVKGLVPAGVEQRLRDKLRRK